jgi:hypothetical protein
MDSVMCFLVRTFGALRTRVFAAMPGIDGDGNQALVIAIFRPGSGFSRFLRLDLGTQIKHFGGRLIPHLIAHYDAALFANLSDIRCRNICRLCQRLGGFRAFAGRFDGVLDLLLEYRHCRRIQIHHQAMTVLAHRLQREQLRLHLGLQFHHHACHAGSVACHTD